MKDQIPIQFGKQSHDPKYYRTIGDDLTLLRRPIVRNFSTAPFKIDKYIVLVCTHGTASGQINLVDHPIEAPGLIVIRPNQLIQLTYFSEDFKGYFFLASSQYLAKMDLRVTEILPIRFIMTLYESPFIKVDSREILDTVAYFNLIFQLAGNDKNPYRDHSIINVIRSFFYETGYFLSKNMDAVSTPKQAPIIERLLPIISKNFIQHKDVAFYASQMNLSPNYLYKIVKNASGKTVTEWIEEYTISEAKSLLRDPKYTIQQISAKLNFPSQSFFGKYFHRIEGMSPKEYRKKILEKE